MLAGLAWIGTLTVLNAALQLTLPQWVRSRGASIYILVFMGAMAIGSIGWGVAAPGLGTPLAYSASAVLLLLVAASVRVLPLLPGTGTVDRSISMSWPTPTLVFEPQPTDGPVLVQISYTVHPDALAAFQTAMGRGRRLVAGPAPRDGPCTGVARSPTCSWRPSWCRRGASSDDRRRSVSPVATARSALQRWPTPTATRRTPLFLDEDLELSVFRPSPAGA